jgi:signal transduction histidine kinase
MNETFSDTAEIRRAFADYDRRVIIDNVKIGCVIGAILMPIGVVLDYCVYREAVGQFLELRLLSSALIGLFWGIVNTSFGHRHARKLGITLAMIPTLFMSWMIYLREGSQSPYYAGLNLVLLVIGFVLYWTFLESLVAVTLVILMYLGACFLHGGISLHHLENNLYFLILTGTTVVTGSYFHSKFRFREFSLRYELDRNRSALEANNRKLMELDQIKSRFFANISHELRTPLTLLLAPLETLLQRFNHALDQETRDMLMTMHSNGMRLLKLINDLLDLVRLESGRLEIKPEPLEVAGFIKGLASAARQVADDKRLRLETFVDPALGTVMADRDRLEKILLNLVFNALKFTPAGGHVQMRAEKQGEELVLVVSDTGMGISETNLPHIFDRFWQADSSSKRKYQGVGIGLALVKELVEIQRGKVEVQSQEGKGTTFTVRLPFQKADALPEAKPPDPSQADTAAEGEDPHASSEEWLANLCRRAELFPALTPVQSSLKPAETSHLRRRPTILVADDEPDMLRFLKSQLHTQYEVLEAVDGQQAIEKASQFLPDLILLDMMMPEKDGLQACREIRDHTPTQNTPIVMLTARADEDTKLAALSTGANDFLPKPFSTTELHVRLKNLLESHQYQRRLSKQNRALESAIEQLKDTETQLVQTEKLASLGRMSAGIIHEINNPLNFATTGLFTLRNKAKYLATDQQEEYQEILKDVEDGLKRVKTIVSDLRMFTHPETESRDQVEVAEVVAASLRFLSNECKDKICLEQHLAERQTIWANKNKLIHVLINLIQNSIDALRSKTFPAGEQPTIWIEGRVQPDKSLLIVRDNGTGIDDEHLDKIFDPFYTTKDVGAGMGLGLAICYRIVQNCDGRITVRTKPGQFCEFTLEFPEKGRVSDNQDSSPQHSTSEAQPTLT